MKINKPTNVTVDAKSIRINAKCSDCFAASLVDSDGSEIADYDGYVPAFMPGNHYGDYIELEIDLESGRIVNWKKPDSGELSDVFFGNGGD